MGLNFKPAKPPKAPKPGTLAAKADRHKLYEHAVQDVVSEIDFVEQTFMQVRGKQASILREDFCGTANTSCEWVRRRDCNRAMCVDYDDAVLNWGNTNNVSQLNTEQQTRIQLLNQNVLDPCPEAADIVLAMNFSYQIFQTRDELRNYFSAVHRGLGPDGILLLDAFGGHDSWRSIKEKTKYKKFTYHWDQHRFDPVNQRMLCYIHFKFKDGSMLKRAFSYDWRMYTLPELREIMLEAGFKNSTVYWEETDEESGDGTGNFFPSEIGEDDPAWIVYVCGEK